MRRLLLSLEQSSSLPYGNNLLTAGDVNSIEIGSNSNIQDGATVHVARHNPQGNIVPTIIGNNVTIGEASRHVFTLCTQAMMLCMLGRLNLW